MLKTTCIAVAFLVSMTTGPEPGTAETSSAFVPGGKLYLHGTLVEPTVKDHELGFFIVRDDSSVTVNGRVYVSQSRWRAIRGERTTGPDPFGEVALWIDKNISIATGGSVLMRDVPVALGDTISVPLSSSKTPARIVFGDRIAYVSHEDIVVKYALPVCIEPDSHQQRFSSFLDDRFSSMRIFLRPGILVLAGDGYLMTFPLSIESEVISSLSKLPSNITTHVGANGSLVYESVTIDGFRWGSSIIEDFLNTTGREQ